MKAYEYCQLKGLILKSILSDNHTARAISENIHFKNPLNPNLYHELGFLVKFGYLSKKRTNHRSEWFLTKHGRDHALDPFVIVKQKQNRVRGMAKKEFDNLIKNTDEYKNEVKRIAFQDAHQSPRIIESKPRTEVEHDIEYITKPIFNPFTNKNDNQQLPIVRNPSKVYIEDKDNDGELKTIDTLLKDLNEANYQLGIKDSALERLRSGATPLIITKNAYQHLDKKTGKFTPIEDKRVVALQESIAQKNTRITALRIHHKKVVNWYYNSRRFLDWNFVQSYSNGEFVPALLRGNFIEWLNHKSAEVFRRGSDKRSKHLIKLLSPNDMPNYDFYVYRIASDGWYVFGKRMKFNKPQYIPF